MLDLGGAQIQLPPTPQMHYTINRPGATFCNGTLRLAPGHHLVIASEGVTLRNVSIVGQHGRPRSRGRRSAAHHTSAFGWVTVCSKGVLLASCEVSEDVEAWYGNVNTPAWAAVAVVAGGGALVQQCELRDVSGDGLLVAGASAGWDEPAMAVATGTISACNGGNGFVSLGQGAGLIATGGCEARYNTHDGFRAELAGFMAVDSGIRSQCNGEAGFCSTGTGSMLTAGGSCVADGSTDVGGRVRLRSKHGFLAVGGGAMHLGADATSSLNRYSGFMADGPGSVLCAGDWPTAAGRHLYGFAARDGGRLVGGNGGKISCVPVWGLPVHGLYAKGRGSMLQVGSGWECFKYVRFERRKLRKLEYGVAVHGGARATVGGMCKVQGAVKFGFLSSGSGSELLLGAGCQGIRNVANFAALNGEGWSWAKAALPERVAGRMASLRLERGLCSSLVTGAWR